MNWSKEGKVILYASQLNVSEHHRSILEEMLADGSLDWHSVFKRSVQEGTTGLVYKTLKRMGYASEIGCADEFSRVYSSTVYGNTLMFEEFQGVLDAFERRRIPVILLRGYALVHWIYHDPGLRPMDDVDILIKKDDLPAAQDILTHLGFHTYPAYPLLYSKKELTIDVHLDVAGLSRIPARRYGFNEEPERWFERCRSFSFTSHGKARPADAFAYQYAFLLEPCDFIISSAVHLVKHSFGRLIWFVDIKEIVEKEKDCFDWNRLSDRTAALGVQKSLYYPIEYIKTLYGISVPQPFWEDLGKETNRFEKLIMRLLLENKKLPRWGDVVFLFSIKKRRERIRYLFGTYFPRREVMSQIFGFSHPFMLYFSYLIRFWQVMYIGWRECARLLLQALSKATGKK